MDGNALAARDIADDVLAADGVATARTVDQQVVLAFDLERVRPLAEEDAFDGVGHVVDGVADDALVGGGLGRNGGPWLELVEHLARGILAEADGGEKLGLGGKAVFGGDLVVVGLAVL